MQRPDRRLRAAILLAAVAVLVGTAACSAAPATPAPPGGPAVPGTEAERDPTAGDRVQERQARLVTVEDGRIYGVTALQTSGSPAYVAPALAPSVVPTAVLTPRAAPYDMAGLVSLGAARRTGGVWDLLMSVVVERGATLRIEAPGQTLRMASGSAGFTSIVAVKGTVELVGAQDQPLTITSWDPVTGVADHDTTDGRSYLRTAGGRLDLTDVSASDLGFWSGRTGGVSWTGSQAEPGTGTALRTVVERSRYGMFASRTAGLTIDSGAVRDNELDGLLVHRRSSGVTVRRLDASHNGRNGITVSAGASQVSLSEVSAHGNAVDGIRIDGTPRTDPAAGPTATPVMPDPGHTFTVERSVLDGNGEAGIVADTAADLNLVGNSVTGSPDGILVTGAGARQQVLGNSVEAGQFGIAVRDGAVETKLTGNTVRTATIALQVSDARADLHQNVVGAARRYAVSLTGSAGGSVVSGNRLGGRGPSAVDTVRIAPGPAVEVDGNDDTGWVVDRDDNRGFLGYLAEHPLLLLWLLILILPVAAGLWTRQRRRVPATPEPVVASRTAPEPHDTETTIAMPVTRVTIVSQAGE